MRASYHIVHGEWTRLLIIVGRWQHEDLIKLADAHALDPADLPPPDPTHYSTGLSSLGHGAAILGASAFSIMTGAVRNCDMLQTLCNNSSPTSRTADQVKALRDLEHRTKDAVKESVLLLEDALAIVPGWLRRERFDLGAPRSEIGTKLTTQLRSIPVKRFGRIRGGIADALRAVARWIDVVPTRK